MFLFGILVVCFVVFYYVSNKEKQGLSSHKKQVVDIIKSFIYLCHSYPKKMDKQFIDNVEVMLMDAIVNKKNFDTWVENQAKKFGSIKIAVYHEINSILGMSCILSDKQLTDMQTETLTRMEAVSHKCLTQAFAKTGKTNLDKSLLVVRKPDIDN